MADARLNLILCGIYATENGFEKKMKEGGDEGSRENFKRLLSFISMIAMTNENIGLKSTELQNERNDFRKI